MNKFLKWSRFRTYVSNVTEQYFSDIFDDEKFLINQKIFHERMLNR